MPPGIVIILILAIATLGILAWRKDQRRQEAVREWAFGRGWRSWPGGDWGPHTEHPGLKLFQRGHSRRSSNVVRGEADGRSVVCCDYRYVTGHGKNRTTHRRGVVVLQTGFPVLPLQIRPEHAFDKVGEFLGFDDIDFESAEFSRRYHVSAADRKWAYDVVHARVMEMLLAKGQGLSVEFGSFEVAVHKRGHCDPAGYERLLDVGTSLLELMPDYVVRQMKGESP